MSEKISEIEKIGKAGSENSEPLDGESKARAAPNQEHFDEFMNRGNEAKQVATPVEGTKAGAPGEKTSLMDQIGELSRRAEAVTRVSSKDLVEKTGKLISELDGIKQKLSQGDVRIKDDYKSLLKNKLTHIDENIRIALSKVGVEYTPVQKATTPAQTPIERFLGFVTDGENKLKTLGAEVQAMHLNRKEIDPASMLMIQIKVGYIQQEVEFFSSLLNKALESTKTIMNIQV